MPGTMSERIVIKIVLVPYCGFSAEVLLARAERNSARPSYRRSLLVRQMGKHVRKGCAGGETRDSKDV
jgi:hypothetical protein